MPSVAELQAAYKKLREKKAERQEIKQTFVDDLNNHARYREVLEELKVLREEKKRIENETYARAAQEVQRLESLKTDLKSHEELISDVAFNLLLEQKPVEVFDEYDNRYEPVFIVRFKKAGLAERPGQSGNTVLEAAVEVAPENPV